MTYLQILPRILALCMILSSSLASSQPPITAAPDLLRRQLPGQDSPSCAGFYSVESSCSSVTTDFSRLPVQSQLNCACYTSSTWAGSIYDGYFSSCLEYISIASPSLFTSGGFAAITGVLTTPCEAFAPAVTSNAAKCLQWNSIEASCSVETPSLGLLPISSQASCLCYVSSTYVPSLFDGAWDGCLSYLSTASPRYYASISADQADRTPCANQGNVRNGPTAAAIPTSPPISSSIRPLTTTEPQSTSVNGNNAAAWKIESLARAVLVVIATAICLL